MSRLENNDISSRQHPGGKRTVPGTIDFETPDVESVGLDDERVLRTGLIVWRKVQNPRNFVPVCSFPTDTLGGTKLHVRELRVQGQKESLAMICSLTHVEVRWRVQVFIERHRNWSVVLHVT